LKGFTVGGAMISPNHAGFIVNTGGATAEDVKKIMGFVERRIYENYGITLQREIVVIE